MKNQNSRLDTHQKGILRPPEVDRLVQAWLLDIRRTLAPDTVSAYGEIVQQYFLAWIDRTGLNLFDVAPSHVEAWLDEMAQTVTKGTVSIRFYGVRSLYRWLYKQREVAWDPTYGVTIPRSQVHPKTNNRKLLNNRQVQELIATCDDDSFKGIRDKAIISLMVYCGLRSVEIHRANVGDFDTQSDRGSDRVILYVWGKGREHRSDDEFVKIPIPSELRINRYVAVCRPGGNALFTYPGETRRLKRGRIYDIVKDRLRIIGLERAPHALRHTFVTNALQNGANIRQVQMAARHVSMDTTIGYAHKIGRMRHAAEDVVDYGEFDPDLSLGLPRRAP